MSVYLDYNATAKVRPEAAEAVARALALGGNPSSVHADGRGARARVETARAEVAALVGVIPAAVTFTSGGTEADALAIQSALAAGCERIIVGATEHEAVAETAKASGVPVEEWRVDEGGIADLEWLTRALDGGRRALVCLMAANNETGVIQPVAEAAGAVRAAGGWLHVDAVQAAGKIALDFEAMGADTMALSAHKLGGPQGVGALIAGPRALLTRQLHGGGQERGLRSGTENVAGIAGFGAAATASIRGLAEIEAMAEQRDRLAAAIKTAGAVVIGESAPRLPQTLCLAMPDFPSELQVMGLDLAGVMVSAGAACTSGKVKASRVVEAMGLPDLSPYVLRVSGGWATTQDEWRRCGEVWLELAARRRARARAEAVA
jgi:cysteine desulfurase